MVTNSTNVDEIYHQMTVIRREPHANVSESVAGAEAVVDWGRYTWAYPWIALGAAGIAVYTIYCGANEKATAPSENPAERVAVSEPVAADSRKHKEQAQTVKNLLLAFGGMVLPVAISAGQNYVLRWLDQQYPARRPGGGSSSPMAAERSHTV